MSVVSGLPVIDGMITATALGGDLQAARMTIERFMKLPINITSVISRIAILNLLKGCFDIINL